MIYDLLVIGGGMSGISVAHYFRGHKVLILEKGSLLQEASGKNAGFLISGFGEHYNRTAARWGRLRANDILNIHRSNHARIKEHALQMNCSFWETGSYQIGLSEKEGSDLEQSAELLREDGFAIQWRRSEDTGLNRTCDVLYNPEDACIDPKQFWCKLATGIPNRIGCEVLHVDPVGELLRVTTTQGDFIGHRIVYCLNAFSAALLPHLAGKYIPLRGQILEIPVSNPEIFRGPVIADYGEIYWRFTADRFLFGGLEYKLPHIEVGIADKVSSELEKLQLSWIREHFDSDLIGSNLRPESRCSTMAFTVDGFPFVGALPTPNEYILSGLCGLGHSYALECASWLYELIEKNENRIPPYFSAERLPGLIPYRGGNWRTLYEAWNH